MMIPTIKSKKGTTVAVALSLCIVQQSYAATAAIVISLNEIVQIVLITLVACVIMYQLILRRRNKARLAVQLSDSAERKENETTEIPTGDSAVTILNKLDGKMPDIAFLDSADIKQLFNISDTTLYRWRRDGEIPFVKMGAKIVYPKQAIQAILQARLDNRYDSLNIKEYQKEH